MKTLVLALFLAGCGDNTQPAKPDAMPDAAPDAGIDPVCLASCENSLSPCEFRYCIETRCLHEQPTPCPQ